jgi:hypothetical protein
MARLSSRNLFKLGIRVVESSPRLAIVSGHHKYNLSHRTCIGFVFHDLNLYQRLVTRRDTVK